MPQRIIVHQSCDTLTHAAIIMSLLRSYDFKCVGPAEKLNFIRYIARQSQNGIQQNSSDGNQTRNLIGFQKLSRKFRRFVFLILQV